MNTSIEVFYEKLRVNILFVKLGLFVTALIEIFNITVAERFINELKILSLESVFMLICMVIYDFSKRYYGGIALVLPNIFLELDDSEEEDDLEEEDSEEEDLEQELE
jgi:hypothetical protein